MKTTHHWSVTVQHSLCISLPDLYNMTSKRRDWHTARFIEFGPTTAVITTLHHGVSLPSWILQVQHCILWKGTWIYIAPYKWQVSRPQGALEALQARHGSHSLTCKQYHACLYPSFAFTRWRCHGLWWQHQVAAYYSSIDPKRTKGWVGQVGWPIADGSPT